jgi:hypothetical protein
MAVEDERDGGLTAAELRAILREAPCVGEIARSGKDAAGKPLENEFYYVPERDDSALRREAVVAGAGRTSLRAVRRNHKVSNFFPFPLSDLRLSLADGRSNISGRSRGSEFCSTWGCFFGGVVQEIAFSVAFSSLLVAAAIGPSSRFYSENLSQRKSAYLTLINVK